MKSQYKSFVGLNAHKGATLIVSLIILAVITIIGLASMRSSNMELRMAASARDRSVAFQAAETALRRIEADLVVTPFGLNSYTPACSGNRCFNPACSNGLCFEGDFDGASSKSHCQLARDNTAARASWQNAARWNNAALESISSTDGNNRDVRYLIEFLCFVPRGELVVTSSDTEADSHVPLYRITARAEGEAGRSTVTLQSIFRAAE